VPLDMRMDQSQARTADQVVNQTSARELYSVLKRGGVGTEAKRIADTIVRSRPVKDTAALSEIVISAVRERREIHPATVVFQAIRMEVNEELKHIAALLEAIPAVILQGGRAAIITFHSIEDRLVTKKMRLWQSGDTAPARWARAPSRTLGKLLQRKPIVPDEAEVTANPAARSARLRVFEFSSE